LLIAAGVFTGAVLGWAIFERYHQDRIFPGIIAAGVNVGGLKVDQAAQKIAAASQSFTPPQLTLKAGDKTLEVSASQLGWQPDAQATARRAFQIGRRSWGERLAAWQRRVQVPLIPKVDQAALKTQLEKLAKSLEYAPKNASIVFKNGQFVVNPDKAGLKLDIQGALEVFGQYPSQTELELMPQSIAAPIGAASLELVAAKASSLLRPVKLAYLRPQGNALYRSLSVTEVASLLSIKDELAINPAALGKLVASIAAGFDQPPANARYVLKGNTLAIRPETPGWKLDQTQAQKLLEAELLRPEVLVVSLPVVAKPALVKAADLPSVDNLQLIAEATTAYAGSTPERIANIYAAAKNLDGYTVPAGGVFNFNQAVGDISPENGFKEALVISGGRTIKGVGGGVCQVSTTAFRALYRAGLPVIERNQHAYRVRWYEPIVGFDAAVYQPYLNLRMLNDTPGPILVRAFPTPTTLTVRLYGIPDGRQVRISNPTILSQTPRPPAQYLIEPTLRPGQIKQVDWAVDGFRTRITRTVTMPSGQTLLHVLNSDFKPWRAVYQVGPGTPIPNQAIASH